MIFPSFSSYTQFGHIHATLLFHRDVHVHRASKRVARHHRVGHFECVRSLNHGGEFVALFNDCGQALGFLLNSGEAYGSMLIASAA